MQHHFTLELLHALLKLLVLRSSLPFGRRLSTCFGRRDRLSYTYAKRFCSFRLATLLEPDFMRIGIALTRPAIGVDSSSCCCCDVIRDGDDQNAASKAGRDWTSIGEGEETLDSVCEKMWSILLNICCLLVVLFHRWQGYGRGTAASHACSSKPPRLLRKDSISGSFAMAMLILLNLNCEPSTCSFSTAKRKVSPHPNPLQEWLCHYMFSLVQAMLFMFPYLTDEHRLRQQSIE
ncbi:hypothetical protein KC354_g156 [Hortaea werneckii]|nr:hypothetical protein KC354_g156 [Hortaea werneckii]